MMLFSKMLRKRARLTESAQPGVAPLVESAAATRKMMLITTWKATSDSAFSTGSEPLSGP